MHTLSNWQYLLMGLFIVCLGIIVATIVYWLLVKVTILILHNKHPHSLTLLDKYWRKPLLATTTLFFLYIIQPLLCLSEKHADYYLLFLNVSLVTLVTWCAIQTLYTIKEIALERLSQKTGKTDFTARALYTQLNLLMKVAIFIVGTVGASFALMLFPHIQQLGYSMLASAGVAGIVIGIAANKSLSTIFAGIQIALTKPIKINDEVIVEGEWGVIEEITLTYIVVCIWDKRRLILPINYFIEKPFQNWTRSSSELIGTINFFMDYTVPLADLRPAIANILATTNLWDGKVNILNVINMRPQEIELRLLLSAADAGTAWDLRCYVREKLVEFLQQYYCHSLPKTRVALMDINNSNCAKTPSSNSIV